MHRQGIAGRSGFVSSTNPKHLPSWGTDNTFWGKLTAQCHPCRFPAAKSPLLVLSLGPHCHSHSGNDLGGSRGGHSCGWDGGWISLCRHSCSVLQWIPLTRYFEDAGDWELCWLLNPFNLSISLASHSSHTSLPSPDDVLFFKITFPFLTSFPHWTQIPLSKLLCTSRLVAATLPHKKEINFSSTVSNYWWQAGKAWKIFGSKKHYSNLIRVQAKLSF